MRKITITNTIDDISLSGRCVTLLLFIFIFGVSTGTFFEIMMSAATKTDMQNYLQSVLFFLPDGGVDSGSALTSLMYSIATSLPLIIFIALSGLVGLAFPISSILLFLKGISLGYASALILETLAFKGVFVIIISLFPQHTLLIPAMIVSADFAVAQAPRLYNGKHSSSGRGLTSDSSYLYINLLFCLLATVGCILQSAVISIAARII